MKHSVKLFVLCFACIVLASPAQAKRYYQLKGNHYVRIYPARHYHRVVKHHVRDFDRPRDGTGGRVVEIGLLGSQRAIEFQYAVGNAVSEALSGSWPYPELCQSNVTWLK